jgi:hypothetical protein
MLFVYGSWLANDDEMYNFLCSGEGKDAINGIHCHDFYFDNHKIAKAKKNLQLP